MRTLALLLAVVSAGAPSLAGQATPESQRFSQDEILGALEQAYPGWVTLRHDAGTAVLTVGGKDFVWAEGRLLPPDQAQHWADYAPQPFYPYPGQTPDVASWSDQRVSDAETRLADRRLAAPRRESGFFDTLWGVHDRGSADAAQQRVNFLGLRVTVHKSLAAPLARIQTRLQAERLTDPTLDSFLNGLAELDGFNWRAIAETQSRSNHAYGAAIDLIPRNYGRKNPYWLWAPQEKPGWYRTAWARRWVPHPSVVQAFEDEGFIWGGKWLLFDTIHFEYRPEILVLNGLR